MSVPCSCVFLSVRSSLQCIALKCMHKLMRKYIKKHYDLSMVQCIYFCCHDRFIVLKYENCWGDLSVIPSTSVLFNEFTDNFFDDLTCFLTKIVSLISLCYINILECNSLSNSSHFNNLQ